MGPAINHFLEKSSHETPCSKPENVKLWQELLPEFNWLSLSTACDDKEKANLLDDHLTRVIRFIVKTKEDDAARSHNNVDFNPADLGIISKIIKQAAAKKIEIFPSHFAKTFAHKLCSDSSPQEIHNFVKLMILLKKESIFGVKDNSERDTALHLAIKKDINLLPATLDLIATKLRICFTLKNRPGNNLLHLASKRASLAVLQRIVHHFNGDLNAKNKLGNTALLHAASRGNSEILQYLATLKGVDVNAQNHRKLTALHSLFFAPVDNFIENLNILVNSGAVINAVDEEGRNILFYAAFHGWSLEVMEAIVKLGGNWRNKDNKGHSILHICLQKCNFELLKYFIQLGVNVNERDTDLGRSVVHLATLRMDTSKLEYLILNGGDVNLKDIQGDTPLSLVMKFNTSNTSNVIQMLIKHGAVFDWRNNSIEKLFMLNSKKKMTTKETVKIIDLVVDLSLVNKNNQSPLHFLATAAANVELAEYLINKGADVNKKDVQGRTPLHLCVASKSDEYFRLVEVLLYNGADINITDKFGLNVILLAAQSGKRQRDLELLVNLGARWNVTDTFGQSIIHILTREGNANGLKYFLSLGANVNAVNKLNETPLHCAKDVKRHFIETVTVLMEHGAQLNAVDFLGFNAFEVAVLVRRRQHELSFMQSIFKRSSRRT